MAWETERNSVLINADMMIHCGQVDLFLAVLLKFEGPVAKITVVEFLFDPLVPLRLSMRDNGFEIFGWIETGQGIIFNPDTEVALFLAVLKHTHEKAEDITSRFEAFPDVIGIVGPGCLHSHLHIHLNSQIIKLTTGAAVYNQSIPTMACSPGIGTSFPVAFEQVMDPGHLNTSWYAA
jgi:hypothetical protein